MILLLNNNFTSKGAITDDTDFMYNDNFRDVGNFAFSVPASKVYPGLTDGTFIKFKNIYGIAKAFEVPADKAVIKGYDIKGLLKQRVVHPGEWTGKPEYIIKRIVTENTTGNRAFPNFSVAPVSSAAADSVSYVLDKSALLSDVVNELCELYDLGYKIAVDGANLTFKTVIPTIRENIVYSNYKGSYSDCVYTYDGLNKANVVYNRAERVGMEVSTTVEYSNIRYGTITVSAGTVYFPSGASYTTDNDTVISGTWDSNRSQWFVYAWHNISSNTYGLDKYDIIPSQAGYEYVILAHIASGNGIVTQRDIAPVITSRYNGSTEPIGFERCETIGNETNGNSEIDRLCSKIFEDNNAVENISAEIINCSDYGSKWYLGDYINIHINALNQSITQTAQVTAVQQSWENGGYKIKPTFGEERKNIIKKILKKI